MARAAENVTGQCHTDRHPDSGVAEISTLRDVTVVGRVISDTSRDRDVFARQFLCCLATAVEQWASLTL